MGTKLFNMVSFEDDTIIDNNHIDSQILDINDMKTAITEELTVIEEAKDISATLTYMAENVSAENIDMVETTLSLFEKRLGTEPGKFVISKEAFSDEYSKEFVASKLLEYRDTIDSTIIVAQEGVGGKISGWFQRLFTTRKALRKNLKDVKKITTKDGSMKGPEWSKFLNINGGNEISADDVITALKGFSNNKENLIQYLEKTTAANKKVLKYLQDSNFFKADDAHEKIGAVVDEVNKIKKDFLDMKLYDENPAKTVIYPPESKVATIAQMAIELSDIKKLSAVFEAYDKVAMAINSRASVLNLARGGIFINAFMTAVMNVNNKSGNHVVATQSYALGKDLTALKRYFMVVGDVYQYAIDMDERTFRTAWAAFKYLNASKA